MYNEQMSGNMMRGGEKEKTRKSFILETSEQSIEDIVVILGRREIIIYTLSMVSIEQAISRQFVL